MACPSCTAERLSAARQEGLVDDLDDGTQSAGLVRLRRDAPGGGKPRAVSDQVRGFAPIRNHFSASGTASLPSSNRWS